MCRGWGLVCRDWGLVFGFRLAGLSFCTPKSLPEAPSVPKTGSLQARPSIVNSSRRFTRFRV